MAQVLTVCRIGTQWGFRDVTGAEYGRSADIDFVLEAAQRMAQRTGGQVVLSPDAEQHYRDQVSTPQPIDSSPVAEAYSPGRFRNLLARLARWRRVK